MLGEINETGDRIVLRIHMNDKNNVYIFYDWRTSSFMIKGIDCDMVYTYRYKTLTAVMTMLRLMSFKIKEIGVMNYDKMPSTEQVIFREMEIGNINKYKGHLIHLHKMVEIDKCMHSEVEKMKKYNTASVKTLVLLTCKQ